MPVKLMDVSEWIAVPDNPIQRDTERHARRAKHLHAPKPTHWICFACQFPDKSLVKLDGHTRALLWKRKEIPEPRTGHLEVHCIPVKNMDECIELYRTFDTKEALETVPDKVSGGFHRLNFHPQSSLLQRGSIASALKVCWNVWKGRGPMSQAVQKAGEKLKDFDIYEAIEEFSPELFALDSFILDHKAIQSGLVAAYILTNRKHGMKVMPFWIGVFGDGGEKVSGRMDGIQAVNEMVLARKGKPYAGQSAILDLCTRTVMACEKWLNNETLTTMPRPMDLRGYIAGVQPSVRLIKCAEKGAA